MTNPTFCTTPFNERQDVKKNQLSVHKFYMSAIERLQERLIYEVQRSTNKFSFKTPQDATTLIEAVKFFFVYEDLYKKHVAKKQTSQKGTNSIFTELMPGLFNNMDYDPSKFEFESDKLHKREHREKPFTQDHEQDQEDDLIDYDTAANQNYKPANESLIGVDDDQVKKQEEALSIVPDKQLATKRETKSEKSNRKSEQTQRKSHSLKRQPIPNNVQNSQRANEDDDDSSVESNDPLSNYADRAQMLINCRFYGNFSTNNIKRKPKEEKIYLDLENVFLKFSDTGREAFFERASFELSKIEKNLNHFEECKRSERGQDSKKKSETLSELK